MTQLEDCLAWFAEARFAAAVVTMSGEKQYKYMLACFNQRIYPFFCPRVDELDFNTQGKQSYSGWSGSGESLSQRTSKLPVMRHLPVTGKRPQKKFILTYKLRSTGACRVMFLTRGYSSGFVRFQARDPCIASQAQTNFTVCK